MSSITTRPAAPTRSTGDADLKNADVCWQALSLSALLGILGAGCTGHTLKPPPPIPIPPDAQERLLEIRTDLERNMQETLGILNEIVDVETPIDRVAVTLTDLARGWGVRAGGARLRELALNPGAPGCYIDLYAKLRYVTLVYDRCPF